MQHHRDPARISLAGALATVRQWAPTFMGLRLRAQRRAQLDAFFRCIAYHTVPNLPNRTEPRARKRRPKNYPLFTSHRTNFKEIQHRGKYTKTLS